MEIVIWEYMVIVARLNTFERIDGFDDTPRPEWGFTEKESIVAKCKNKKMDEALLVIGEKGWELVCINDSSNEINRRLFYFKRKCK